VSCHGRNVSVFFEHSANHVYTDDYDASVHGTCEIIKRRIGPGRYDERAFALDRARLMDEIIRAVRYYTFSIPGTGQHNRQNRLLHGPRLQDGRHLRVALSPGPRESWYCKSAYPIDAAKWKLLRGSKTVRFPP
jgi:hypothetical protein